VVIQPGKYRRAFEWRLHRADKEAVDSAAQAFIGLSAPEYAEVFEDYLFISRRRRRNRTALAKLQIHLIEELVNCEKAIKHHKQEEEQLMSSSPQAPRTESHIDRVRESLRVVKRELFFHRMYANTIRAIGDGLAWRALNYDRAALRFLCERATKQQILSEGSLAELEVWAHSFDKGTGLAIFNALTNCLALGDVTVVKNDGTVEIVEVKASSTKSRRITRQKEKLREVVELLNFGEGEHERERIEILHHDIELENGLPELLRMLGEATERGCTAGRISNFCYVECADFQAMKDFDSSRQYWDEMRQKETAPWLASKDVVVDMDSLDLLAFSPNKAPYSIYPFPEKVCIDLLTGASCYRCFFNYSALHREFERAGWQVLEGPKELMTEHADEQTPMFKLKKGACNLHVPPGDIMRLQMELLRPKVLLKSLEDIYKLGPRGAPRGTLVAYEREASIWN